MPGRRLLRYLLVGAGCVSVALGVVGIFVPVMPTSPFLLLAAVCFVRSSERLHTWLITHRWLGIYVRDYVEHRAITKRAKVVGLVLLWLSVGCSGLWIVRSPALRLVLLLIALIGTIFLLHVRTLTPEMRSGHRKEGDK
jgi:uncharacterized membrane protein YbaN (DUF454 family)